MAKNGYATKTLKMPIPQYLMGELWIRLLYVIAHSMDSKKPPHIIFSFLQNCMTIFNHRRVTINHSSPHPLASMKLLHPSIKPLYE